LFADHKQGSGFPLANVVVIFVFNDLRRDEVVRFVDIDEIVDHHCLRWYHTLQVKFDLLI
jgi:hypothetical protein